MSEDLVKNIVYIESVGLIILIIIASLATIVFEAYHKRKQNITFFIETILLKFISEKVDLLYEYVPEHMLKLKYFLPPMLKIDHLIKDPFWEYLKEEIITQYLSKEIMINLHSLRWSQTQNAILAISLFPEYKYEKIILKFLLYKKELIRFSSAKCAVLFSTEKSIVSMIRALSQEPLRTQFTFRDALIYSNETTHQYVYQLFKKTTDIKIKIACLKILALKLGFLRFEDVKQYCYSANLELKWWSLRALENIPSKESLETLNTLTTDPHWAIRSLCIYCLGSLKALNYKSTLQRLLSDKHDWVRFMAALCLKFLGPEGESILLSQTQEPSLDVYKTCQYILTIPETSLEKGLQKFFPINQDPLSIIEAIL